MISREIKFRCWDLNNKEMLSHEYMIKLNNHLSYSEVFKDGILDFPIMQFTGLKDKNGKEIYEGDVVKARGIKAQIIVYQEASFEMQLIQNRNNRTILSKNFASKYEVIGNIYENPELLEG